MTDPVTSPALSAPVATAARPAGASGTAGARSLDPLVLVQPGALLTVVLALLVVLLVGVAAVVGRRLVRRSNEGEGPHAAELSPVAVAELDDDEQFVVDLLRANDGQVQQSNIVDASDWSKSKVSRLLSRMERDGYVEKITVGRRNLVVLDWSERDD